MLDDGRIVVADSRSGLWVRCSWSHGSKGNFIDIKAGKTIEG